jgi:anaerobic selenocysteine-containing dehydrogenase
MSDWKKTTCGLCLQSCGLEVLVQDNRISKVRPDRENPRSQGYVCRKGLKIAHLQHHRQRLEQPLMRVDDKLVPTDWDSALDGISAKLTELIDEHGPRCLAFMAGGSGGCQIGGRFASRLLFGLGSRYLYTALGQEWTGRHYVRGRVYGNQALMHHPDHDNLDMLLALGWNGWSSHGMPQTRRYLKKLSEDKERLLVVVDPRPSETAKLADIHLALTPGSDALLLKAMIAIILQEGWADQAFIEAHTGGFDEVAGLLADFDIKAALEVCGLEYAQVREVCRLFSSRNSALMSDLGVLMNRQSTYVSFLEEILLAACGRIGARGGNVFNGMVSPVGIHTPPENPGTWRTQSTDIPAIMGAFPPNVLPEEIESGRDDRIRAVVVVGANPLRSYADTQAYQRAFSKLDLLVVLDVALSETAALAHYVLAGRTAYESHDTTFWSFNYPEVYFNMRRPVLEPQPETRETGWIIGSLAEKMGVLPEIPPSLTQTAQENRDRFGAELASFVETTPGGGLILPLILAKTLGPVLGSNHLAFLWGLLETAPYGLKQSMAREGFEFGHDQSWRAYDAIMSSPSGLWLGRLDPERSLEPVANPDGKIMLNSQELLEGLRTIDPDSEAQALRPDPEFPLLLMAGWHNDSNANTLMRDPAWNQGRRVGCLAMHPKDAALLGLSDGDQAELSTKAGRVQLEVEFTSLTRPGLVLLPQGFGLDYAGEVVGVNVNWLTAAEHRDPIAGTPHHRRIPCRVSKV